MLISTSHGEKALSFSLNGKLKIYFYGIWKLVNRWTKYIKNHDDGAKGNIFLTAVCLFVNNKISSLIFFYLVSYRTNENKNKYGIIRSAVSLSRWLFEFEFEFICCRNPSIAIYIYIYINPSSLQCAARIIFQFTQFPPEKASLLRIQN
jgi:hypothetical protein